MNIKRGLKAAVGVWAGVGVCVVLVNCWTIAINNAPIWVFLFPLVFAGAMLAYEIMAWGLELKKPKKVKA